MDQNKIGNLIKKIRKNKNMTQEELANKLGCNCKTISRWETGNYMPDISMLKPLSEELDLTLNELLSGDIINDEINEKIIEEKIKKTIEYSQNEINKNKRAYIKKISIILFTSIITIFALLTTFDKIYFTQSSYKEGNVEMWKDLFPNHSAYDMALNDKNEPVFKNPSKALKQAKSDYSDAIKIIKKQFKLLPLTKYTYKPYGIYGWQVITDDEMISKQGNKITQFIDIYENSFK